MKFQYITDKNILKVPREKTRYIIQRTGNDNIGILSVILDSIRKQCPPKFREKKLSILESLYRRTKEKIFPQRKDSKFIFHIPSLRKVIEDEIQEMGFNRIEKKRSVKGFRFVGHFSGNQSRLQQKVGRSREKMELIDYVFIFICGN